jgi:hypothetical protein
MTYAINAAIAVSIDGTNWFNLTDHNRQPVQYTPQRIEQVQRMANGSMRKMVIANKALYDVSWQQTPTASQSITSQSGQTIPNYQPTVDGNYGAGFMKAFYDKYVFQPIWIQLTFATDNYNGNAHVPSKLVSPSTGNNQILKVFMTDFKYTVTKRLTLLDYVDVTMQFTEV